MLSKQRCAVLGGCLGACLIGLALISEFTTVRLRGSERTALRGSAAEFHGELMRLEDQVPAGRETLDALWKAHLRTVDRALERNDISSAVRAWHDAYVSALGTRRWEGMVEVGDAYLRIGEVAKGRKAAEAKARQAYLTALFRARNEGSLDGVLRSLQAFAALGDREVLERGLYIAERLAAATPDLEARARVRAVREQLAGQFSATGP